MRRGEESAEYRHQRLQTLMFDELRASLRDDVSDAALIELRVHGGGAVRRLPARARSVPWAPPVFRYVR
jgi:hypothetical protein